MFFFDFNKKIVSDDYSVTRDATKQMFDLKYSNDSSLYVV